MPRTPPLPPELWEQIPPAVQALLLMIIEGYERRITALEREVAELKEQVRRTSQNSSKPPSSDGPHVKRQPPKAPSGRKPGGQPGHPVHRRALVPLEQVQEVVVCKPRAHQKPGIALHAG
jgi:transposase